MRTTRFSLFVLLTVALFSGCDKTTLENIDGAAYQTQRLTELFPLQVGKYIVYRTDSTVFTNFGTETQIHSYQEKNLIDAQITDASGRISYRVYRYLRDTAGVQPWQSAGTYFITPLSNQVEVVENNLRFIKLHLPVQKDFTWNGNSYLNNNPYEQYSFLNDDYMNTWKYTYISTSDIFNYNQQTLNNVVKVVQVDERFAIDTVDVSNNTATIKRDSASAVWVRGSASDTVRISAPVPAFGFEKLTIYNQTDKYATLNGIAIPPKLSLYFEFANNKWYYPKPLTVVNNKVTIPKGASIVYIFGNATDSIKVDISQIDTLQTRKLTVYNRSNFDAFCSFPSLNTYPIPPGYGRSYEIQSKNWILFQNRNVLYDKDPYSTDLPFGNTSYSAEKYAKGVGMVYQEVILWEYQPNTGGQGGYKAGFGVRRSMIDHN
jgi:hypothetical protein